jgi:hypothetical protein
VDIDGPPPEPGTAILFGEAEAGEMRSHTAGIGLALLRLEILEQLAASDEPLKAGNARLIPRKLSWMVF